MAEGKPADGPPTAPRSFAKGELGYTWTDCGRWRVAWAADDNVLVQGTDVGLGLGPSELLVLDLTGAAIDGIPYEEVSCRADRPGRIDLADLVGPYATLEPLGSETAEELAAEIDRRKARTMSGGETQEAGTLPTIAGAGCLSALVTGVLVASSLNETLDMFVAIMFVLGALLVALPIVGVLFLAFGKRYGAKVILGVWLGLIVPALFVWWLADTFSRMM